MAIEGYEVIVTFYQNKYIARISRNGDSRYLGSFDNEIDAAEAYQIALANINK